MLAFFCLVFIMSFGCNSGSKQEEQAEERKSRLWKGYGEADTVSKPVQFKKIH
jgi:hypothetical protein